MKVLIINDESTLKGGAEILIQQLKESLQGQGHTVKVLSSSHHQRVATINDYGFRSFRDTSSWRFLLYIFNPFALVALWKILKEFRPDVVHLHNISKASASILLPLKNYPVIMTAHDFECINPTMFSRLRALHPYRESYRQYFIFSKSPRYYAQKFRYYLLRVTQRNIDTFIAPSKAMARVLKEAGIAAPIVVVYNSAKRPRRTKPVRYQYRQHPPKILFVGRLVGEKGVHVLISAMAVVLESFPEAVLTIVGDGPEKKTLQQLAGTHKAARSINFVGSLPQAQLERYYETTDIVVVPSMWYEPFGIVAVEAMMRGKPVIASKSGGLTEIIDDKKTGLLIRPGDAVQLANAISSLVNDSKLTEAMGAASLKRSELFSEAAFVSHTLAVYKKAITKYQKEDT